MGVKLIPRASGEVTFAKIGKQGPIKGRWTRNKVEYTGASWGFDDMLVTWQLFHRGKRLELSGKDVDDREGLIFDEDVDARLIDKKRPFVAESIGSRSRIRYRLSGSNHFGSCSLHMELVIDLRAGTARRRTIHAYVDIAD